ncbi:MAG: glycogen/starch/alpha-glucan phosphorylase, partial [Janthinobacterium lividum]
MPTLEPLATAFVRHLISDCGIDLPQSDDRQRYEAAARSIRDVLMRRWIDTQRTYDRENPKRVNYLSLEFLIGRSLSNNISNLLLEPKIAALVAETGIDLLSVIEQEPDAGLGNGGLGRLAACFLESMATMQLPAIGYGLRYQYGMFRQTIVDGWQNEQPDPWLQQQDPWEIARPGETVEVTFGCTLEIHDGALRLVPGQASTLMGIPYDRPVVGFGGNTVNTLRLWQAAPQTEFDFREFGTGDFVGAVVGTIAAHTLTRVLYPDDSTESGQELRFAQEYFLVACSLADIVRRFRRDNADWTALPDKAALQLNDTHPALAVPELMRLLLDTAGLGWDTSWDLTRRTLAYTNHTLLPEALERWPLRFFEDVLPRHLEIIREIDRRLLKDVEGRFPGDAAMATRISLFETAPDVRVRMANLAIVGSHSTNGVAQIHSDLLRTTTVKELAALFPERFSNKTNGVTPRRWLLQANPALAATITDTIGDGWITDFAEIERLKPAATDPAFIRRFQSAKRDAKIRFGNWLDTSLGVSINPDAMFDCQIKRIHEYKRQMMNALRVVILYDRLRTDPSFDMAPRVVFFGGKAAPAYTLAKLIIKFINNLAGTIDGDPAVRGRLKVVFLPEYCVSLAERLIPAADVSNQISTAGFEASGTSNMKFMMNGALTLGTRDGATIEMADRAGEESFFLFGLTAQQVADSAGWYDPRWHYEHDPETRRALDLIAGDRFSRNEPGVFAPLLAMLLQNGDRFRHLADLGAYLQTDRALCDLYSIPDKWAAKAIVNVAS